MYVALGDSVPAGAGANPKVSGYPELLAGLLADGYNPAADKATPNASLEFEVVNLAVSGATTARVREGQLAPALTLSEERDGTRTRSTTSRSSR